MKRLMALLFSVLMIAVVFAARPPGLVGPDEAGATLRFDKPLGEREPFCQSTMAADPGCAFRVVLVEVDGAKIIAAPNRSSYRVAPGEHTIVVQFGIIGNYGVQRGRQGKNMRWYTNYGHPGAITVNVRDGETFRIYGRNIPATDQNPFGWEGVAKKSG